MKLYHSPVSRSSRVVRLLDEADLLDRVEIVEVTIPRIDGTGGPDPKNPHPEGKVPLLVDGDETVRETNAILAYLTDAFPGAGLGPVAGEAGRGAYLSWLAWYGNVLEPLLILDVAEAAHPVFDVTFRDLGAAFDRLDAALARGPWLLGDRFSAADVICSSPFSWFPDKLPDRPAIRDWVARVEARPAAARQADRDAARAA